MSKLPRDSRNVRDIRSLQLPRLLAKIILSVDDLILFAIGPGAADFGLIFLEGRWKVVLVLSAALLRCGQTNERPEAEGSGEVASILPNLKQPPRYP